MSETSAYINQLPDFTGSDGYIPVGDLNGAGGGKVKLSDVSGGQGGGIPEAPADGRIYGRKDRGWTEITGDVPVTVQATKVVADRSIGLMARYFSGELESVTCDYYVSNAAGSESVPVHVDLDVDKLPFKWPAGTRDTQGQPMDNIITLKFKKKLTEYTSIVVTIDHTDEAAASTAPTNVDLKGKNVGDLIANWYSYTYIVVKEIGDDFIKICQSKVGPTGIFYGMRVTPDAAEKTIIGAVTPQAVIDSDFKEYNIGFGEDVSAKGVYATSRGNDALASGAYNIANGTSVSAIGHYSIAFGLSTNLSGNHAYANGHHCKVEGNYAYAQGAFANAVGNYSHAVGGGCSAIGDAAHAEGSQTYAADENMGYKTGEHAEGYKTSAIGRGSHSEDSETIASANGGQAHAEGYNTSALGDHAHTEGINTLATQGNAHAEGDATSACGSISHTEGGHTLAYCAAAHAEGWYTSAYGNDNHTEGDHTTTIQEDTTSTGKWSEESWKNGSAHQIDTWKRTYNGVDYSAIYNEESKEYEVSAHLTKYSVVAHAEGNYTSAFGDCSHAEGSHTLAQGYASCAAGSATSAMAKYSCAMGLGTWTTVETQLVCGKYNKVAPDGQYTKLFCVGNGSDSQHRQDAFAVYDYGGAGITWIEKLMVGQGTVIPGIHVTTTTPPADAKQASIYVYNGELYIKY